MKDGKAVEQDPEVVKLLTDLEKVKEWAEPVKKGKRVRLNRIVDLRKSMLFP